MSETVAFSSLLLPEIPTPKTMFEFLVSIVRRFRDNTAFVYTIGAEEHRVTYLKLFEDVAILARAFRKQGVGPGDKVMIFSDNRYAWIVTDFALSSLGAVSVPRGTDTTAPELGYIVEHAECSYLVVEHGAALDKHAALIGELKQLKAIFVMEAPPLHTLFSNIYSYNDLLSDRRYTAKDIEHFLATGSSQSTEDLLTIIYTSGTTGQPKGVPLNHRNILHNINVLPELIQLTEQDTWLSILPSWHIFERTAEYVALAGGTTIVYSSIRSFAQDLEKYRPTLVATVPRVWESLYSKVQAGLSKKSKLSQRLFGFMIWVSASYRRNKRLALGRMPVFTQENWLVRLGKRKVAVLKTLLLLPVYKLAQHKLQLVRQRFGGRLRLAISGGGSLAGYLEDWIDAVGIRIVNAYGMTECSPAIAGRGLSCRTFGTLGPPVPRTEVRIVSEKGEILPAGVEGEVEVRGEQVTGGYYKNDDETVKSFTVDGYFRTGDLGKLTIKGELVLTGRVKEIIVLSSGENIDPTRIENAISVFPFIQDAVLVGQDKKGLGALLVPNIEELKHYVATKMNGLVKDTDDLLTNVKVLDHVRQELNRILKPQRGFKAYEKLQNITFLDKEFKLGEELTNTLKKKRHVIEKKYHELINQLLH
jgi:long-chain acyl-CoA synthetase